MQLRVCEVFEPKGVGKLKSASESLVDISKHFFHLVFVAKEDYASIVARDTLNFSYYRVDREPDYDALYLPLSENGATANMVMCSFTFNYQAYLKTRAPSVMTKRR